MISSIQYIKINDSECIVFLHDDKYFIHQNDSVSKIIKIIKIFNTESDENVKKYLYENIKSIIKS